MDFPHVYQFDASIFIFSVLFHFSMNIMSANRIAPDGTPRFAASHLGLFCFPISHKKDARLIWVKTLYYHKQSLNMPSAYVLN